MSQSGTPEKNHHYAVLMETNGGEYESWYHFIRYEGNEDALSYLEQQFKKVEFYIIDDLSTFDIELKRLVSEETARQMCKIDLNAYMFHRKFDGKLDMIDFNFSKRDDNETMIEKVNEKIGMGEIDRYITNEDPCDSDFSDVETECSLLDDDDEDFIFTQEKAYRELTEKRDVREDVRKDDRKREEPKRDSREDDRKRDSREDDRKRDSREDDRKREEPKRDSREDDRKREEPKRDSREDDRKRDAPKRDEPKRDEPKREDSKREDSKRGDQPRREDERKRDSREPKREDPKREDPKRDVRDERKRVSRDDDRKREESHEDKKEHKNEKDLKTERKRH
jgi:hypothetical protein